jgi:hypothetical protein
VAIEVKVFEAPHGGTFPDLLYGKDIRGLDLTRHEITTRAGMG